MRINIEYQINERYNMKEVKINCYRNKTIDIYNLKNWLDPMLKVKGQVRGGKRRSSELNDSDDNKNFNKTNTMANQQKQNMPQTKPMFNTLMIFGLLIY